MSTENRYKLDISLFPEGDMLIHYGRIGTWGIDPFTDSDKHNFIEAIKGFEFIADGKGNHYNFSVLDSLNTEGTGTVEGEIWLTVMLHGMDAETFRSIEEWRTVGQK